MMAVSILYRMQHSIRTNSIDSPNPAKHQQGRIFVERDSLALIATDEKGFAVGPAASWTLSEDKVSGCFY